MLCVNNQLPVKSIKNNPTSKQKEISFKAIKYSPFSLSALKNSSKAIRNCAVGLLLTTGSMVTPSCVMDEEVTPISSITANHKAYTDLFEQKTTELKTTNNNIITNLFIGVRLSYYKDDNYHHTSETYTKLCDISYDNESITYNLRNNINLKNLREDLQKIFLKKQDFRYSTNYLNPHENEFDEEYTNGINNIFKTTKSNKDLLKNLIDYRTNYSYKSSYECIIKLLDEFIPLTEKNEQALENIKNSTLSYEEKLKEIKKLH